MLSIDTWRSLLICAVVLLGVGVNTRRVGFALPARRTALRSGRCSHHTSRSGGLLVRGVFMLSFLVVVFVVGFVRVPSAPLVAFAAAHVCCVLS